MNPMIREELLQGFGKPHLSDCNIEPPPHLCNCQLDTIADLLAQARAEGAVEALEQVKMGELPEPFNPTIREKVAEMNERTRAFNNRVDALITHYQDKESEWRG